MIEFTTITISHFLHLVNNVTRRFRCLGLNFHYRIESYKLSSWKEIEKRIPWELSFSVSELKI